MNGSGGTGQDTGESFRPVGEGAGGGCAMDMTGGEGGMGFPGKDGVGRGQEALEDPPDANAEESRPPPRRTSRVAREAQLDKQGGGRGGGAAVDSGPCKDAEGPAS